MSQNCTGKNSLAENEDSQSALSAGKASTAEFSWQLGLDTGHCKVFLESEDVGRTLDLSCFGSYEELYMRLANMFGLERSEIDRCRICMCSTMMQQVLLIGNIFTLVLKFDSTDLTSKQKPFRCIFLSNPTFINRGFISLFLLQ